MILVPSFLFQSAKLLATMPLEEVGTVPGSYRIVDMFCLREVLNQIMKVFVLICLTISDNLSVSAPAGLEKVFLFIRTCPPPPCPPSTAC